MASRKEQKEALRREREEREAAARAAARRRRLIGYGAGGAVVAVVAVVLVVLLVAGGGGADGGGPGGEDLLPAGIDVPAQRVTELDEAVEAAGCELKSFRATSREHTTDPAERLTYDSKPPTSGRHFETPADDGEYDRAPTVGALVHSLEHGRVLIWFRKSLPRNDRGMLKALFDEDPYQMLITPDPTGMTYAVAATAWNADPQPNGTGRLLGCPRFTPAVVDAIRAFKEEHRSNGPEPVP